MDDAARLSPADPEGGIAALIAAQPAGFALSHPFYCDPAIYRRDIERIFMRHWLCLGHESGLVEPGDFAIFEIGAESLILARGDDGTLRAFANVCRHRGSRICSERSGRARFLVCPYHGWTYGLDGSLQAARHMPDSFDRAAAGLKPLALAVIEGVVLVSFAASPPRLGNVAATFRDCLGPFGWAGARLAHRETYAIAANWKLAVENYLECYHCAPAHPEYARLHALEQPAPRMAALAANMEERAAALGITIPLHDHWAASTEGEEPVYGFRYPLYDGVVTGSADGEPVAPPMLVGFDGAATSVHLGPASFLLAYADHGVIYRFVPKAPEQCEMEVIWLVRGDAKPGIDYDPARLTWLWTVTSEQDKRIVEQNQLGIRSRFYEPGPYAPMEQNTARNTAWYLREIA
jgi:Rieske 2Fe-2S family protein